MDRVLEICQEVRTCQLNTGILHQRRAILLIIVFVLHTKFDNSYKESSRHKIFDSAYKVSQHKVWRSTASLVDDLGLAGVDYQRLALGSYGYQQQIWEQVHVCGRLTSASVSNLASSRGCWWRSTVTSPNDHQRPSLIYRQCGNQRIGPSYQHTFQRCQVQWGSLFHWRYRSGVTNEVGQFIGNSTRSSLLFICPQ